MPELPEVETVRRGLAELVIGKTIEHVDVRLARIIRTPDDVRKFASDLCGCTIEAVNRRGKYLLFSVPPFTLISHLRMEGQYRVVQQTDELAPHTHVIFRFTTGEELRYRDVRQFGTMDLVTSPDQFPKGLRALGPEPFDETLTEKQFYLSLHKRKAPIKAVLLDQTCVAGLGNIYVDEALFEAGIHPEQSAEKVTQRQSTTLLHAIRDVLARAIAAGGSSIKSYVNGYGRHGGFQMQLSVYGQSEKPCKRCGTPIAKIRVAGRGTHFCPNCQPQPRRNHR